MSKLTMGLVPVWTVIMAISAKSPVPLGHLSEKRGQKAGIQTYPFLLIINDYSPTLVKFERSLPVLLLVSITVRRSRTDED